MTLADRLNQIISDQRLSKCEFAQRIAIGFGYDENWLLNERSDCPLPLSPSCGISNRGVEEQQMQDFVFAELNQTHRISSCYDMCKPHNWIGLSQENARSSAG